MMNYQGYLTDNTSNPVTGSFPMIFKLYPDSTTGSVLWSESYASVSVTAGVFNVVIGAVTPLPLSVFTGAKLWLQTTVNGSDILPRRPLVTVAYSFRSAVADFAASGGADLWTSSGSDIYRDTGKVGIGTSAPAARLEVDVDSPATAVTDDAMVFVTNKNTTSNNLTGLWFPQVVSRSRLKRSVASLPV